MFKVSFSRFLIAAAALSATACAWNKQAGTGVEVESAMVQPPPTLDNPYGAEPYHPSNENTIYTPPVAEVPAVVTPATTATVGQYAAVDTTATTHRVVSGDTVYNISKRYGISQDDLRAWNGLTGNAISVNQVLYVRPVDRVAPPTPTVSAANVGHYPAVDITASTHRVVSGDTVYNISKRYGISQDDLRAWNGLNGNAISINQVLRVKPAGYVAPQKVTIPAVAATPAVVASTKDSSSAPKVAVAPANKSNPTVSTTSSNKAAGITWQVPTNGTILNSFGGSNKGIDIAGTKGQAIAAAADGKVVYAGSGLRGYGNLLVIQHNKTYLTAYGNNDSLLVKEGQEVKRGQTIAKMGNSDSDTVKLHFELREEGVPINPTRFIKF